MNASTKKYAARLTASFALATAITMTGCAAQQQVVLRDDAVITKDVQERIAADPDVSGAKIAVDTQAGIVSLTGAVKTDTQRNSAERVARDTPGVRSVDNNVRFGSAE